MNAGSSMFTHKQWSKKYEMILLIAIGILLISVASVDAEFNDGNNNDNWTAKHELEIYEHQLNKTFNANGEDEAKMNIVIKNKTTNILVIAESDIEVLLRSEGGIFKSRKVTIFKDQAMSEDISLTSTQSGNIRVFAEAVGFEVASTSVEFVPPLNPSELNLTAQPNENILANGKESTKLTVKLLNPDSSLFIPQSDKQIDIWTNKGEKLPQIKIYTGKPYVQTELRTYKQGNVEIIANSPDFNLQDHANVTFVSPISLLGLAALLGGFLGGIAKYYKDYSKKISFLPKPNKNHTWQLGMLGHAFFHALFGFLVFVGAFFDVPATNIFSLPVYVGWGVFFIGVLGGIFFFVILSIWEILYKKISGWVD